MIVTMEFVQSEENLEKWGSWKIKIYRRGESRILNDENTKSQNFATVNCA